MQTPPKFSGWFDQLLTTGLKILPGVLGGGGPSKPKAPTGCMISKLSDSGQVSACIDQMATAWKQIEAQIGTVDPAIILQQAGTLRDALHNPNYFDQTGANEARAYLQSAQATADTWYNNLAARLSGQTVVTTNPATGQLTTINVPIATVAATQLIPGIPNTYLFGGALGLTALLLLKK